MEEKGGVWKGGNGSENRPGWIPVGFAARGWRGPLLEVKSVAVFLFFIIFVF